MANVAGQPCFRVKPPKITKKQVACYDEEQTGALLQAASEESLNLQVLINLAIASGLRRGELMGLEWQDINFIENTLRVQRSSQYLPGNGVFTKEPKTETSKRVLSVPGSVMALLKLFKASQAEERLKAGDNWKDTGRLFVTWDGKPMSPDIISSWFPQFLKKHGLPHVPFHGLRHTSATFAHWPGATCQSNKLPTRP
jgi:integrase